MADRIYYRDFETGKVHWTRGKFKGWIIGGLLKTWHVVIQRKRSVLYIPVYCLLPESRDELPPTPDRPVYSIPKE